MTVTESGAAEAASRRGPLPIVAGLAEGGAPDPRSAGLAGAIGGRLPDVTVDDLPALLTAFYARLADDPLLAPYFVGLDMAAHIPRLADFWATVAFDANRYRGNAFRPHAAMPGLDAPRFARWLAAFEATVDARHAGDRAERMKVVAHRIASSMQLRLGVVPAVIPERAFGAAR